MHQYVHQKAVDFLNVFQEVTRLISTVHDPQQVMDLVVQRLPGLMEVDAATIRLLDTATGDFVIGAANGVSDEYLARTVIDSEEVMDSLLDGRPAARSDLAQSCDHEGCQWILKEGVQGAMSLPIIFKDEVIGILRLLTRKSREFTQAELNFASSLAEQVGLALANSRMFQELENQLNYLSEMRRISRLVNSTLDLEKILSAIVEKLPSTMQVKGCTIRLLQPATNMLDLVAAKGVSENYLKRGSINKEDAFFRVLKGEPVAIYDAANDDRVDYHDDIRQEGIKSILVVPIKNGAEIIGVLRLLTDQYRSFTSNEIDFVTAVAEEGGNAIQKARTYTQITLLFNQIEEHERFLQSILDSLRLQLLVMAPDKSVIMVNRNFLECWGFKESDVLGQAHDDIVPWQLDPKSCPIEKVIATRKPLLEQSSSSPDTQSSDPQFCEHHFVPILGSDSNVEFVIEATRDVTSERLLEMEKLARVKLEGVVEMAGTAAHQLNTPLFAALGTAQLLEDDLPPGPLVEEMSTIIRNLQEMGKLIREMTEVTGFETANYVGDTRIVKLINTT